MSERITVTEIEANWLTDYEFHLYQLAQELITQDETLTDLVVMKGSSLTINPDYVDAAILAELAYDRAYPIRKDYY
jgi:hypothetical protein